MDDASSSNLPASNDLEIQPPGTNPKRKGSSDTQPTPTSKDYSTFDRDPDFCFEDGTVYISAENTLFRVYRGNLARHSELFRLMFELPPPSSPALAGDFLDGIPVVPVQDTAEEIRDLLRVMHDTQPLDVPFDLLRNVIRMAHKYQLDQYLTWAIGHFKKNYPTISDPLEKVRHDLRWVAICKDPSKVVGFIEVVELIDIPELQDMSALAFYALATMQWNPQTSNFMANLPPLIIEKVIVLQRTLQTLQIRDLKKLANNPCGSTQCNWITRAQESLTSAFFGDYLYTMTLLPKLTQEPVACAKCRVTATACAGAARQRFSALSGMANGVYLFAMSGT